MTARKFFHTSLTRISDLRDGSFDCEVLERTHWQRGDYVVARVTGTSNALYRFELDTGRMVEVMAADRAIGALGERCATLEGVGSWSDVGSDGRMHALTSGGLFGRATSTSTLLPPLMTLRYAGHVMRNGEKVCMRDFVVPTPSRTLNAPVVLLMGTSMSAGKTTTGRLVIHELKSAGLKVTAAKLTGAGRYRDILSFRDAGADQVLDFVDAGLPSTVVPEDRFREAMDYMLARIAATAPDVVVVESGASPLEPYNGDTAIHQLRSRIRCTVLCASDPYAVVGVRKAFPLEPDVVTGPAAGTDAAVALVHKLANLPAINIMDPAGVAAVGALVRRKLGLVESIAG